MGKDHLSIHVPGYSAEEVYRAAYWFTNRCDVRVTERGHALHVDLWPKHSVDLDRLERQFHTALMETRLRRLIDEETQDIRKVIWEAALKEAWPKDNVGS